ncbi:hypothetical protein CBR_g53541 [Chara braunii]|uniref:Uncharacterized protein n=1 Tax=Chara braunii TaxID=69332 RepID=A0A388MAY7_CHABU|nr:hypothetical protein CBR_g53541 [Chara braunii]|eukprot:GBG91726.1 hypothetical protein CBR_g53541 [Chara braunii]
MEEMEAKKQRDSADASKKKWDKVDQRQQGEVSKGGDGGDCKKRDQGSMAGGLDGTQQPRNGRPRMENPANPLDTGLIRMDIDTVRKAQEAQASMVHDPPTPASPTVPSAPSRRMPATEPGPSRSRTDRNDTPTGAGFSARLAGMFASVAGNGTRRRPNGISINEGGSANQVMGFDRINRGKKAAVAGPGKEGRKKYIDDLINVLFAKTKHELEELCKKEMIKYVNKKITSAALARLRAIDAYGEESDEEESEEEIQEENPSS